MEQEFIVHDFKLPNHGNELSKADDIIEKLKKKLQVFQTQKAIDDKTFGVFYEEIIRVLDYVGRLSMPCFAVEEELEQMYVLKYHKFPELGRKLCFDHYEKIHHPYTLLKNRCFKLLDELDETYKALYKKNPPNWNY